MRQTYILSILIIGVLLSACSKLERTDFTNVEANNFFKTEKDVDAALTNYYSTGMLDWNNFDWSISIPFNTDSQADIWRFAWDDYNQDEWTFDLHNFLVTYNESRFPYSKIVQGISKGTTLIEKIKGANIDETFKKSAITQVKVLRCNLAYWGQTLFGGTELFLDPNILADVNTGKYTARKTPKEMCDFIVGQIDSIKNDLEDKYDKASPSYGRATKGFALTIKLKSLMHQKRFAEAEATAREITTLGYGLVPKYKDIFTVENEKNIETIMSVICQPLIYPYNNFNAVFLSYDYVGTNPKLQNYAEAAMEWDFYDTFDTLDVRRNEIITDYINNGGEHITRGTGSLERGAIVLKYAEDPADIGSSSGVDAIYFRYADVLLYLAEAINENSGPTQEAIDLVNQIRARAFPEHPEKLFNLSDFAGSQQAFRDALYRERGCELYCEGWRRDDMIRMGKFDAWGKSQNPNYKPTMQLWPIPPRVIDQSKGIVVQNPGY